MKQFTLNMNKKYQRPIVELKTWHNFEALLDTGAYFPIWTDDEHILDDLGGRLVKKDIFFGGFGGTARGCLYELESMTVGGLIFPNTHIIACRDLKDVPFQLILSATMFRGLIYEIDDKNHRLNITVPDKESTVRNLRIEDSEGRVHILSHSLYPESALSHS